MALASRIRATSCPSGNAISSCFLNQCFRRGCGVYIDDAAHAAQKSYGGLGDEMVSITSGFQDMPCRYVYMPLVMDLVRIEDFG